MPVPPDESLEFQFDRRVTELETRSAFHVSTGPTEHACVGTPATYPPPLVRAFWITVMG